MTIRRELAAAYPDRYRPDLAGSLSTSVPGSPSWTMTEPWLPSRRQ